MNLMFEFGERLRVGRKKLGLTQREMSEKIGICYKTLILYESGKRYPQVTILPALAAIGVDLNYLVLGAIQNGFSCPYCGCLYADDFSLDKTFQACYFVKTAKCESCHRHVIIESDTKTIYRLVGIEDELDWLVHWVVSLKGEKHNLLKKVLLKEIARLEDLASENLLIKDGDKA